MDAVELEQNELDELLKEAEAEEYAEAEAASRPTKEEQEKARELARKMNQGFLWLTNRTQCPSVKLTDLVDPADGEEAFTPLAEKWGGEVPPWLLQFQPYIAAGVYMGMTIATARAAEAQAQEIMRQRDGEKSESRAA